MTREQVRLPADKLGRAIEVAVSTFIALTGLFLIESVLEGADILPHYFLRLDVFYDAHKAVSMLIIGQVTFFAGLLLPWLFKKASK